MSSLKIGDGGPAFPWCGDLNECHTINLGMSLRDYFAAHAPEEIPEWFKKVPLAPQSMSVSERERYYAEKSRERYFAWRWHYAEMMIKARGGAA